MNGKIKNVAIIGGGPRGLSALESLYRYAASKKDLFPVQTLLVEGGELPGAGHVYDVKQPDTNWLNVSERGLTISARAEIRLNSTLIPSFPSYQDWMGYDSNEHSIESPDKFPLRSNLGGYLNERYTSIAMVLQRKGLLEVVFGKVIETDWQHDLFAITLENKDTFFSKEVVLTIGHQSTNDDKQIGHWLNYSKDSKRIDLIREPYPVENILKSEVLNENSVVALRGFGLAMIDVMRALTTGLGGHFEIKDPATGKMSYQRSGKEPRLIIPFSLDGLPMAPKPLNLKIDQWFFPTDKEIEDLGTSLKRIAENGKQKTIAFLLNAITPIVSRVYGNLENMAYPHDLGQNQIQQLSNDWLADPDFKHYLLVSKNDLAVNTLEAYVGMATGMAPISLDFCIGHVWRHCQPTMYRALSFSNLDDEVIAKIVLLDERLKRYSYGPPVDSLQQLLALIKEDVVTLNFVDDPEIKTMADGWKLFKNKRSVSANIMVNTVLDAPKLLEIDTPIVSDLLHTSIIEPVHNELGVDTYENACVVLSEERSEIPLAVLGRLSKGTLIGVDAILECFGSRSEFWAEGVIQRLYGK